MNQKKKHTRNEEEKVSKHKIVGWLNKTISLIASIAAIIAALYAYKAYRDNLPAKISVYSDYYLGKSMSLDDKSFLVHLIAPDYWYDSANNQIDRHNPDKNMILILEIQQGLPYYVNNSNKSISNLKLDVTIEYGNYYDGFGFCQKAINEDYEIIEHDPVHHVYKLRYKYDKLEPKSCIPHPIKYGFPPYSYPNNMYGFIMPDSVCCPDHNYFDFSFSYDITYDGIPKNQDIFVKYIVYNCPNCYVNTCDEHVDSFLTNCYLSGCFTKTKQTTIVSILNMYNVQIVKLPKRLTDKRFEKYKTIFIKDYLK